MFDLAVVELFVGPYELLFAENEFVVGRICASQGNQQVILCS